MSKEWISRIMRGVFVMLGVALLLQGKVRSKPVDKGAEHATQLELEGKIDRALEEYRLYLDEHPLDVSVARRFLGLLYREKRYEELVQVFATLDPQLQGLRDLTALAGRAYMSLGKKEEGIGIFLSIVSRENGSINSYHYVGNTLLSLGYVSEAKEVFEKGRRKWGKRSFSREFYHCYMRLQDTHGAFRELLNLYLENEVSREWVIREIGTLIAKEETLLDYLESIARDEPEYSALAGEIFLGHGNIALAKEFLLHVLDDESLIAFAALCIEKGYLTESEEVLQRIVNDGKDTYIKEQAYLLLALNYRKTERIGEALKMLDHVINEGSAFRDSATVQKAEILLVDSKEYQESTSLLEQLLARNNALAQRDRFLTLLFTGYLRMGDIDKAEQLVSTLITPLSFFFSGEALFLKGSFTPSQDKFKRAVARGLDRNFANDALERIMLMETLKFKPPLLELIRGIEFSIARERYEEAIDLINGGFDEFDEKDEVGMLLYAKARVHSHQGLVNEAISSYLNAADESPESPFAPKALYHAAVLYRDRMRDPAMASELLRRIIFDYPGSVEAELSRRELQVL